MKGALVEYASAFGMSVPNVVVFQFNPETIRHTWTQAAIVDPNGPNPLAVKGPPTEAFSFTLAMDSSDELAGAGLAPLGVAARIAALETLLFPVPIEGGATGGGSGDGSRAVPASQLPTVLFVWGPGRILPVRLSSLTITEKIFNDKLFPTHAEAVLELRVLTTIELESASGPLAGLARTALEISQNARSLLAMANLGEAAREVIALIPPTFPGV